jgi:hypothetical protein
VPKKILSARRVPVEGYRYRVHLDTDKVRSDGEPDPAYVREWVFGDAPPEYAVGTRDLDGKPPAGAKRMTVAEYQAQLDAEVRALADLELERMGRTGSKLGSEGEEF